MKRFAKFSSVGVLNTTFSYLIFAALVAWGINYILAASVSYISGTALSYYINARHTFKVERQLEDYLKFFLINLLSFSIGILLLYIQKEWLLINVYLAQIIVVFFRLPFTYIFSRKFVFNKL